jgi:uncharacterized cupredoxin-like copper-binding protein
MNRVLILLLVLAVTALAAVLVLRTTGPTEEAAGRWLRVEQPPGKVVYWVLPGPRRVDPAVFGTPQNPTMTGEGQVQRAKGPVKALLQQLPILVGLPLPLRATTPDGTRYTQTTIPTPFGDRGRIVNGRLAVTYIDRQPTDTSGDPMATEDEARLELAFTDPAGHRYEVKLLRVFMPPLPGYETDGGVLLDGFHHGRTGTGSPLMPKVYTYGAFWGIADLVIDGQVADRRKVTHCMTTNAVRDQNYRLAIEEELPLSPERTIAGQIHHTHCIVLPVTVTPQGPKYAPVKTAFTLPNGEKQPFIHIMFEQDQITQVQGVSLPKTYEQLKAKLAAAGVGTAGRTTPAPLPTEGEVSKAARTVTVEAYEFRFEPTRIEVEPGETLKIVFENEGSIAHNLTIEGLDAATPTIQPGTSAELTVTFPEDLKAYPVEFFCSVPGHKEAGMVGQFVLKK